MPSPLKYSVSLLTITLSLLLLSACSSGPEVKPGDKRLDASEKKVIAVQQDALDMTPPTPEQLAGSPCGNTGWAKLPPQQGGPTQGASLTGSQAFKRIQQEKPVDIKPIEENDVDVSPEDEPLSGPTPKKK